MADDRGMTALEFDTWTTLAPVLELLPAALDSQLSKSAGLTLFDYCVLRELRNAPQQTMRTTALAAITSATLPRTSRVASRLEGEGLVHRFPCPLDGRATNVALTPAGRRVLEKATPGHVEAVRALVLDGLSEEQLTQLRDVAATLLKRLQPHADEPVDRQTLEHA